MSVSVGLLDSMLSPGVGGGGGHQQQAETLYRSIPLTNRVRELTALLGQLNNTDNTNTNAGRAMLAAVLLRREISTLAGSEQMTGIPSAQAVSLMGDIAEPLMSLFTMQDVGVVKQSRRQVGHCIAELCGSLSVVSPENGQEWMKNVLGRLQPGVSS